MVRDGFGVELFHSFVPPSARARAQDAPVPLVSGALLAAHTLWLGGPVLEVTWPGRALMEGVLRAVRHADALLTVCVPAELRLSSPSASRLVVDEVLEAARAASFDRPLVLSARAVRGGGGTRGEHLLDLAFRDLEAGFTAMAVASSSLGDDLDLLAGIAAPLLEQDLGVEVELEPGGSAALLLARIDDIGLSVSAVRGASADDELGRALLVVEDGAPLPRGVPARVVIDAAIARAMRRARPALELEECRGDLPTDLHARLEAFAYMETLNACARLSAESTASRLLDALVAVVST